MGWADRISVDEVRDIKTFSDYARQVCGVPYPTKSSMGAATKFVNELFEQYPALTWEALCQIPLWAKMKKRRFPHSLALLQSYRYAYSDGYLPELDISAEEKVLQIKLAEALRDEKDPEWRRMLLEARGSARKTVFEEWEKRKVAQ